MGLVSPLAPSRPSLAPRDSPAMSDDFSLSEVSRRLHAMVSVGTVATVDHAKGKLRALIAGRLSGWLPVPGPVARNWIGWFPVRDDAQVVVASPSGDPANGVVAQVLYKADQPPPARSPDIDVVTFNDGTTLRYDSGAKKLLIETPGDITLECDGDMRLKAGGTIWLDAARVRVFEGG